MLLHAELAAQFTLEKKYTKKIRFDCDDTGLAGKIDGIMCQYKALFSSQKFSFLTTVALRFYLTNIVQTRSN